MILVDGPDELLPLVSRDLVIEAGAECELCLRSHGPSSPRAKGRALKVARGLTVTVAWGPASDEVAASECDDEATQGTMHAPHDIKEKVFNFSTTDN